MLDCVSVWLAPDKAYRAESPAIYIKQIVFRVKRPGLEPSPRKWVFVEVVEKVGRLGPFQERHRDGRLFRPRAR